MKQVVDGIARAFWLFALCGLLLGAALAALLLWLL